MASIHIPDLGTVEDESGFVQLEKCSDGKFCVGKDGVISITATGDGKVEFIAFSSRTLAYVKSALGYPAYYPIHPVRVEKPIKAVLMDLDGTSIRSEGFWIWIIEKTTASLLNNPNSNWKRLICLLYRVIASQNIMRTIEWDDGVVKLNELAILLASSFCAYGFARIRFAGRDFWFAIVLATMMVPYVVMLVPICDLQPATLD